MKQSEIYNKSVFVNFPFDPIGSPYKELFNAVIFTIKDCGFEPRCALDRDDGSEKRIIKIIDLIKECRLSIHDISLTKLCNGYPGFNMPFEVGLAIGAKKFGVSPKQRSKSCLIFEKKKNEYDRYFSDISGNDIKCHDMQVKTLIESTRDWLSKLVHESTPGGDWIFKRYNVFLDDLPIICDERKWNPENLHYIDYLQAISYWLNMSPLERK